MMSCSKKYLCKILFFIYFLIFSVNYEAYTKEISPSPQKFCLIHFGYTNFENNEDALKKLDIIVVDYYHFSRIPENIKKINPNIKIFAYINVFDVTDLSRFASGTGNLSGKTGQMYDEWKYFNGRENLFLHDFRGKRISVFLNKKIPRYAINIWDCEVVNFFRRKIINVLISGYDGVFLDNVWIKNPFSFGLGNWISGIPPFINEDMWSDATADMLAELKKSAGKGKIIFNQINPSDVEGSIKYLKACDGASDEEWLKRKFFKSDSHYEALKLISLASKDGKIILALSKSNDYEEALFYFSAYLLVADGKNIYFSAGNRYSIKQFNFYNFYNVSIGKPVSAFKRNDNYDIYYRIFENGAVVVNFGNKSIDLRDLKEFSGFSYEIKYGKINSYRLLPECSVILIKKKQ